MRRFRRQARADPLPRMLAARWPFPRGRSRRLAHWPIEAAAALTPEKPWQRRLAASVHHAQITLQMHPG